MNQVNSITFKAKYKHLSNDAIRAIIREFNEFMISTTAAFRATHKNHHLKVPKRNINKTNYLKNLANKYNTSLSNLYKLLYLIYIKL